MPQLDTTTFPSQLFWLGVCFVILYLILAYFLVPKMATIIESREAIREEKVNLASMYREQAEGLLMDYEKALAQARDDAQQRYQSDVNEALLAMAKKKKLMLEKLQERFHVAELELRRERVKVSAEMHSVAQELAGEILQKLTGQTYSADQLVVHKDKV